MEQKQSKNHYVAEDDTTKVVKLMIRTSAVGELPMKFETRYMRVAKEIPDEIVQKLIGQEIERATKLEGMGGVYKQEKRS